MSTVLDVTELPQLLMKKRSIFIIGIRAKQLWTRNINAYPFHQGALVVLSADDEIRYPTLFLCSQSDKFIISPTIPDWFPELWNQHIAGFLEHKPTGFRLPDYARPPLKINW